MGRRRTVGSALAAVERARVGVDVVDGRGRARAHAVLLDTTKQCVKHILHTWNFGTDCRQYSKMIE